MTVRLGWLWLPYVSLLFLNFSNVSHFACFWPITLKRNCISNVYRFFFLVVLFRYFFLLNLLMFCLNCLRPILISLSSPLFRAWSQVIALANLSNSVYVSNFNNLVNELMLNWYFWEIDANNSISIGWHFRTTHGQLLIYKTNFMITVSTNQCKSLSKWPQWTFGESTAEKKNRNERKAFVGFSVRTFDRDLPSGE